MAVVAITKEYYDDGGVALELQDLDAILVVPADTSIQFQNDGNVVAIIRSTAVGTVTVTAEGVPDPKGRSADVVYTIPIGSVTPQFAMVPFLDPSMFNAGGLATLTLQTVTGITFALIRLRKRT